MNTKTKTIQEFKIEKHREKLAQFWSSIAKLVQEQCFNPVSVILFG